MRRISIWSLVLGCFCLLGTSSCLKSTEGSGLANVIFKALDGCEVNQCVYISLEVTKKNDPNKVLIKPDMVSIDTGAGGDLKKEDSPYLFTLAYYSTDKKVTYKNNTPETVDFSKSKDGVLDVEIPVTKQNGSSKGEKQLTAKSEVITKTTVKGVISEEDIKAIPAEIRASVNTEDCKIVSASPETSTEMGYFVQECSGTADVKLPDKINGQKKDEQCSQCNTNPQPVYDNSIPQAVQSTTPTYRPNNTQYQSQQQVHSGCRSLCPRCQCVSYCTRCRRPLLNLLTGGHFCSYSYGY